MNLILLTLLGDECDDDEDDDNEEDDDDNDDDPYFKIGYRCKQMAN